MSPQSRRPRRALRAALLGGLALLVGCATASEADVEAEYRLHLHEGHVALQNDEPEDAADAYRRALLLRPDAAEALHGIARCYSARGDGSSALTVLMRLEAAHPAYHHAHANADLRFALYQAAKQNLWAGDSARALALLKRLSRLEPGHPGLRELRTEALLREAARFYVGGRVSEAEALTADLVGRKQTGVDAALALSEVLLERDRPELAISVLSDAQRRFPGDWRLALLMERALRIRYPMELPEPEETLPEAEAGDPAHDPPAEEVPVQEGPS